MCEDNDVQISRLGNWIRMVPFIGKEKKSGVRMEGIKEKGGKKFNLGHVQT